MSDYTKVSEYTTVRITFNKEAHYKPVLTWFVDKQDDCTHFYFIYEKYKYYAISLISVVFYNEFIITAFPGSFLDLF